MKARLLESREIAPGTRHFEFEAIDWEAAFVPGQFLSVTATNRRRRDHARLFDRFAAGRQTIRVLRESGAGRQALAIPVSAETGRRDRFQGAVWRIHTSAARFPIRSWSRPEPGSPRFVPCCFAGLREHPDRRFTLIFGVRHEQGLLYHDEWRALAAEYPNFDYRPTLTRPAENWTGRTGRVQQHTLDALGERRDVDVYICGLREMVDDVRLKLKETGLDRKRIIYEKYD